MTGLALRCARLRRAGVASVLILTSAACSSSTPSFDALESLRQLPQPQDPSTTATESSTTIPPTQEACEKSKDRPELKSFAPDPIPPPGEMPAGTFMQVIADRGHLRVGVDENTRGFASRDHRSGEIEGFEVELAREIAERIFGDRRKIVSWPVVTETKVKSVQEGKVDLSVSAITMTCDRWEAVAFSAEYYRAVQKFLVRSDSGIDTADDLAGRRVCVTSSSTSIDLLEKHIPEAKPVPVRARTDCLVALQEGEVDAYFGHDSFLYGMLSQDPYLDVKALIPAADTETHYGIAISRDHPEFVRFVNAVLEEIIADGTWASLHHDWLEVELGIPPDEAPQPQYRLST